MVLSILFLDTLMMMMMYGVFDGPTIDLVALLVGIYFMLEVALRIFAYGWENFFNDRNDVFTMMRNR